MHSPLYRLIADEMKTRISTGAYPVGHPLPTETQLEREFNVSRITIRQALGLLKRRGLVVSRSGRGTIVRKKLVETEAAQSTGPLRDLTYYARNTNYEPIDRKLVKPPSGVAALFDKGDGQRMYRFRGIRSTSARGRFCFEEVYALENLGEHINNNELGGRTIFSLIEQTNHLNIVEVEQHLKAVTAPKHVREYLQLPKALPLLQATRIYNTEDDYVGEVAIVYYDTRQFAYTMMLHPD